MATIGCDYSSARPSPTTLVNAGFKFVVRYVAHNSSKAISGSEATSLHNAGLTIAFVFEDYTNPLDNWGGNGISNVAAYNGGVSDATFAVGQLNALGVPSSRPIYVACDADPSIILGSDPNKIYQYFQGWSDTIGTRTAFYGGSRLFNALVGAGVLNQFALFWEAAAYSWSDYQVPAPGAVMVQELGSPVASTDEDIAYVVDFGQWPAPAAQPPAPPSPSGATYTANVTASTSFAQPYAQSLVTPRDSHDQVIYSVTTSDAILANGTNNGFYQIPTNIGQTAYPIGMFSFDGGNTYNDFGVILPIVTTYASVQPSVALQPVVDNSGNIIFNGVNRTGSSVGLIIKIALLASYSPKVMHDPPFVTQDLSYTNVAKPFFPTTLPYASYRRIKSDAVASPGDTTLAHNLGNVPNLMFWTQVSGKTTIDAIGWQSTGSIGDLGIKFDATNITFHINGATYGQVYYRTYKDN